MPVGARQGNGVEEAAPIRMPHLVEDLHVISLAEVGGLRLELVETDLGELAAEVLATYAHAAELADITLRFEHEDEGVRAAIDAL